MVLRKTLAWALIAWVVSGLPARADGLNAGGWQSFSGSVEGGGYNAFVNLGSGPFPDAGSVTTGNAQAWYNSPQVTSLFGGTPTAQQQSAFDATVMQRVEQTFQLSGVAVALTDTPTPTAPHTLSLVSNTSAQLLPGAIGMTYIGGNGFSFIDQEASASQTLDQLEWIAAHNIAHELMLAFGVGENYDKSGNFVDARNATFAMMTSPTATFSPAAADALNQALGAANAAASAPGQFAQVIGSQPVPEPATVALWALGVLGVVLYRRSR